MAQKLTSQLAEQLLSDVAPEKEFVVENGIIIKNIQDLHNAIAEMSEENFSHHRNNTKNDFYNWVTDVVQDKRLAHALARAKTKKTTIKKLQRRIDSLKKIVEKRG